MRDSARLPRALGVAIWLVAVLWLMQLAVAVFALQPATLGVRPGEVDQLYGVVTAPLVHGSVGHLASNTASLLVLTVTAFYGFPRAATLALPCIWLGAGLGVWCFGRDATHLGASGLSHGLMFFVFVMGVLRRDRRSMGLAMITFLLYGGMVWGIFPREPGISFESHLFGALTGLTAALALHRRDPLDEPPRYAWETDAAAEAEDPVIGDLWKDADAPEVPRARPEAPARPDADDRPRI